MASVLEKLLHMLNPISSAEATPQFPGESGYPYANANSAALAYGAGKSDDDVWKKYKLYRAKTMQGHGLLGEIDDSAAKLRRQEVPNSTPAPSITGFLQNLVTGELPGPKYTPITHGSLAQVLNHPALLAGQKRLSNVQTDLHFPSIGESITPEGATKINGPLTSYGKLLSKVLGNETLNSMTKGKSNEANMPTSIETSALYKDMLSTLLHEVTHAKNSIYGGLPGASTNDQSYNDYWKNEGELQARVTQARYNMTPAQRAIESPATTLKRLQSLEASDHTGLYK
jgi:hypothetical protein